MKYTFNLKKIAILVTISSILASCVNHEVFTDNNNNIKKEPQKNDVLQNTISSIKNSQIGSSDYYINLANSENNPEIKNALLLKASEILLSDNKIDAAKYYIKQIEEDNRYQYSINEFNELKSKLDILNSIGDSANKNNINNNQALIRSNLVSIDLFVTNKNYDNAISLVNDTLLLMTKQKDKQELVDKTWGWLSQLSYNQINYNLSNSVDNFVQIWYKLAEINLKNRGLNEELIKDVNSLVEENKNYNYPLLQTLPTVFQNKDQIKSIVYKSVAVILPLSNQNTKRIANDIKEGINAANKENGITINYYDSSTLTIQNIVKQIHQNNNQAIIGPLLENNVREIISNSSGLKILALNRYSTPSDNVCYISMSLDDEVKTTANFIYKNKHNPLVITNERNYRYINSFNDTWIKLSNNSIKSANFTDNSQLKEILENNISDDINAIYLITNSSNDLMQLKGLIDNEYYDKKIAIYTNSSANSNKITKNVLNDLKNVYITENSLITEQNGVLFKEAVSKVGSNYIDLRLYSYGYSSYYILQQIDALNNINGYYLNSKIGSIYKTDQNGCYLGSIYNFYVINNKEFKKVN